MNQARDDGDDADLALRDAALIGAGEFSFGARIVGAALFVRVVSAVVLVIALPRLEDAPTVAAPVLDRTARVERAVTCNQSSLLLHSELLLQSLFYHVIIYIIIIY